MKSQLNSLWQQVEQCMLAQQHGLRRRIKHLQRAAHAPTPDLSGKVQALAADIQASMEQRQGRLEAMPKVDINQELPVGEHWEEIAAAIQEHQVVVVAGETGSGKTTQLPKICMKLGRGVAGMIGHTQPRRIAARSVAARIAEELNTPLGDAVGFKVRFSDHTKPSAYVKLMTDGILLAELQADRHLSQYDTIIIDEAHERSLNIDFLLGYLKKLLPKRPDLKIIITSATIDTKRFADHFHHAPVIEVSGRTYPVEIRYHEMEEGEEEPEMLDALLDAVDEISRLDRHGDILVFLSGEREIREATEALRKHHPSHVEILPLYSRLSAAEQAKVFQLSNRQRIILSTNVAETSLTVPGIRYVVDTGLARMSRYSFRSKIQRLPIEKVSQSSANQRAGRCGRISAGVCIRLYSEEDFNARREFTEPEIQRTNLAAVILQMRLLGLGNPEEFPFIDPPDRGFINDGFRLLQELGAMDDKRRLTNLGKRLAKLPVDPRVGRMLLEATKQDCLHEVLIIASALSIQDPRERPADKQQQADQMHRVFLREDSQHEESDFMALLDLWLWHEEQRKHLSHNQLRKACRKHFLSYMRMREWRETHSQLTKLMREMGHKPNTNKAGYEAIHRALLPGLLSNIGLRKETAEKQPGKKPKKGLPAYAAARGGEFLLFPGSGIVKKRPKWIMAAELVETTRLFGRMAARIEPEWVEDCAAHLVKRSYTEPTWNPKRAQVNALESVALFGLVLQAGRRVNYGPIEPSLAREIFIREALMAGRYRSRAPFFVHNQALIHEAQEQEAMTRRQDVLVDDEQLFAFFDERLPASIYNGPAFEKWRKPAERKNPKLLFLSREDVFQSQSAADTRAYPGEIQVSGIRLGLSYCFNPGGEDDGVTVHIPLGALNQVSAEAFEWLVPGLLGEKIAALLKALPKALRKQLVPIPDTAERLAKTLERAKEGRLTAAIRTQILRLSGVDIPENAWRDVDLPMHLQMRYRIFDAEDKTVAVSRDLSALQVGHGHEATTDFHEVLETNEWTRTGLTRWDFGDLPEFVEMERGGSRYRAYPAIVDRQDSVAIELFDQEAQAAVELRAGLKRLVALCLAKPVKYVRKHIEGNKSLCLAYATVGECGELQESLLGLVIEQCFFPQGYGIREQAGFAASLEKQQSEFMLVANRLMELVESILKAHHELQKRIKHGLPLQAMEAVNDIKSQLNGLVFPGFLAQIPYEWLQHIPRFLQAVHIRLDKLIQDPGSDRSRYKKLQPYLKIVQEKQTLLGDACEELRILRWMLEEYRVSLFAQGLKTSVPVSPKRLDELVKDINMK